MSPEQTERELLRLEPIAQRLAARFYVQGLDRDDLLQLARIGIWEACEAWDGRRPLDALANVCARRNVVDAVVASRRFKRFADRPPLSFDAVGPDEEPELHGAIATTTSLAAQLDAREQLRAAIDTLPSLSAMEREHFAAAFRGEPYWRRDGQRFKAGENAVERARGKMRAAMHPRLAA